MNYYQLDDQGFRKNVLNGVRLPKAPMKQTNVGEAPSHCKDTDLKDMRDLLQSNSKGFQLH